MKLTELTATRKSGFLMILMVLLATAIISCAGNSTVKNENPGKVIEEFYKLLQQGNYEKAAAMYSYKGRKLPDEEIKTMKRILSKTYDNYKNKGGIKDFIIIEETIIGDNKTAKVKYNLVFNNGDEDDKEQAFEKIERKWYLKVLPSIK